MASLVQNDYHKIGQDIIDEDGVDRSDPKKMQDVQGGDGDYEHEVGKWIEQHPEILELPADQMSKQIGLGLAPEDAEIYDGASPEERANMLLYITQTAGQGSLVDYMEQQVNTDEYEEEVE